MLKAARDVNVTVDATLDLCSISRPAAHRRRLHSQAAAFVMLDVAFLSFVEMKKELASRSRNVLHVVDDDVA